MDPLTKLLLSLVAIALYVGFVLTVAKFCDFNDYEDDDNVC